MAEVDHPSLQQQAASAYAVSNCTGRGSRVHFGVAESDPAARYSGRRSMSTGLWLLV